MDLWNKTKLGRTGLATSRLGLASSYGVGTPDVERAFERGINYFYWGSSRRPGFGKAIANLAPRHRERMVVIVQSYTRVGWLMRGSLERALRKLRLEYTDVLLLGWWQSPPPARILDAALAEREVFPVLAEARPGVVAYTATRWGALLNPELVPPGEQVPRASDCYRFALTHPAVNTVLSGPKNAAELDEAMAALDRGPLDEEELAWIKRVGAAVRNSTMLRSGNPIVQLLDRLSVKKRLPAGSAHHQSP